MATYVTTTREEVILAILNTLNGLSEFTHVERRLPSYENLQQFANTQFPVVALVAGLPQPTEKFSSRGPGGVIDKVISQLDVELFVYLMDNDNADAAISEMLEALWVALLEDESQGDLVLGTTLVPEREVEFWHPYVAFKVTVSMRYIHTKGGI